MRSTRHDRPVIRVRSAMERMSRGKWLSGEEVKKMSRKFVRCCKTARESTVLQNAFNADCEIHGMINGMSPYQFSGFTVNYTKVAIFFAGRKQLHDGSAEYNLFKMMIEEMSNNGN